MPRNRLATLGIRGHRQVAASTVQTEKNMDLNRRTLLIASALGATLGASAQAETATKKVLRYAFEVAETGLDPAKVTDLYSRTLTAHIFEGLYAYDHLARPAKIKPRTADGMPQHSDDFRTWTVKLRPGIFFANDPAFKGVRRELVAQDYVYSFKRFADPANKCPGWSDMEADGYLGLGELRQAALDKRQPFDYDREIEGIKAIDRYTIRFSMAEPRPRFVQTLAQTDIYGAVAREVIEHYRDESDPPPVGTGPFRLAQWRRSAFIALERNPDYREVLYDAEPAGDDVEGQALLARFKGRRLPLIDRVEISIIEEEQPRWLSFVSGEADFALRVGYQFATQAMPNGKVAPNLAKKGIHGYLIVEPAANFFYFNMDDPVVGGYTPEKVALRRAIGLGLDVRTIINYAYTGLGTVSEGPTLPNTSAFDPNFKSESGDYDPARANALLDLYGYRKGANGLRTTPDGQPLVLKISGTSVQRDRKIAEIWSKNLSALGIRMDAHIAQWPDLLKAAQAGSLQVWGLGMYASTPDSVGFYATMDSHQVGGDNFARFKRPEMDALYRDLKFMPDGPERLAKFHEADRIALAYMPYKFAYNRVSIDMTQPQLIGYRRPVFWLDWWQYADIDMSQVSTA